MATSHLSSLATAAKYATHLALGSPAPAPLTALTVLLCLVSVMICVMLLMHNWGLEGCPTHGGQAQPTWQSWCDFRPYVFELHNSNSARVQSDLTIISPLPTSSHRQQDSTQNLRIHSFTAHLGGGRMCRWRISRPWRKLGRH